MALMMIKPMIVQAICGKKVKEIGALKYSPSGFVSEVYLCLRLNLWTVTSFRGRLLMRYSRHKLE